MFMNKSISILNFEQSALINSHKMQRVLYILGV